MRTLILALLLITTALPVLAKGESSAPLTIGESFTVESSVLGETRRINVYRPTQAAEQPLPVLYLLDGGLGEDFLHIAGLLQVSVGNGTMRPFLLVGIENTDRRRDMTGPTDNAEDRKMAPTAGGSAAFRSFLRQELLPTMSERYATTGETAIIGESFAGLFVVETLLHEPDLFDSYVALDPSLWWNDKRLLGEALALQLAGNGKHRKLFIAASADFGDKAADLFANAFCEPGTFTVARICEFLPTETHATIFHPAALKAFRSLFKPAASEPPTAESAADS